MRTINEIIIHCSDSPDTRDIGVKEITEWHIARGFKTVGYHAVVRRNGSIEIGRPEEEVGAHVEGHNATSLGVCLVGQKDFSPAQMIALFTLVRSWMRKYNIPYANVKGHYEYQPGKTCPNLDCNAIRKALV